MAVNTQNINAKSVAKYVLLPGIFPRVREFVGSGFGYLAFLFASVYGAVRILPPGHPYLNPANIGKFGLIKVIAAAANNLSMKRENLDQIVVFFALLAAVVLVFLQSLLFLLAVFSGQALAQVQISQSIFETPYPQTDIAFMMLDYVFGIPGQTAASFFGSNALAGGPTPFHQGLHALFNFYNLAILLIAVLIFLYYVIVVVIETAQTGVPFGKRFSKLYAPFRLIVAVGLLVPLNYGFNGAQYVTLYAAKLGSSLATNGWILYNDVLAQSAGAGGGGGGGTNAGSSTNNPTGAPNASLVARPRTPSIDELLYFSSVYHACREMYMIWNPLQFQNPSAGGTEIAPYVIVNGAAQNFLDYDYNAAKTAFGNNDIEVVLGEHDPAEHQAYAGGVRPYCGKLNVSLSNDNPAIYSASAGSPSFATRGVRAVENLWYTTAQTVLRDGPANTFGAFGERAAHTFVPGGPNSAHNVCWEATTLGDAGQCGNPNWFPPASTFDSMLNSYRVTNSSAIMAIYNDYRRNLNLQVPDELRRRGWGGAGIWYNHIADINGTLSAAIYAVPTVKQFPEVMEFVKRQRQVQDNATGICETYDPNLADNKQVEFRYPNEIYMAKAFNAAYKYHICEKPNQESGTNVGTRQPNRPNPAGAVCPDTTISVGGANRGLSTNTIVNVIAIIFGINGLFDIRCNSQMDAATGMAEVHPLAQLSVVGKSLIENAIRSMAMAVGAAFGGGILGVLNQSLGAALESASGMFVGIATIGLTAGFLLYYILPFLPFMYFFFAVGSWVKSIFEAMVGVPLWALAHLRIDGDGLPGRAAAGGYFLILEIALRPIFIVFGLIGGMAVFGAMAVGLNNLFDLVVINITGATPGAGTGSTILTGSVDSVRRGIIDQFFFTIMYAVLLYMMATTSFKMIDQIPQNVMRWIGSSVSVFNDNKQDPTQGLTTYTALAGSQLAPQMLEGVRGAARGLGAGGGQALKDMMSGGSNPSNNGGNTPGTGG